MNADDFANSDATELGQLIVGMRDAYRNGQNAMAFARQFKGTRDNSAASALIAYDLQAGSYVADARANPDKKELWCNQVAGILGSYLDTNNSVLEVGCGEATTLAGVMRKMSSKSLQAYGFDISWSRCAYGALWLTELNTQANLFVADLFRIPLTDSSIDVVYTSHSLEPNGGREFDALKELLRVARRAVVLIEPIFELADKQAQARMKSHGYVRDLKRTAESLGATVSDYRLLEYSGNPLNPSGLVLLEKSKSEPIGDINDIRWRCPLTHGPMLPDSECFLALETGIVYPVLAGIPLLRSTHAVVASAYNSLVTGLKVAK